YVLVEYEIDGGGIQKLIEFRTNGPTGVDKALYDDTDFDGIGDGVMLTNTFNEFTKTIPVTGSTITLRLKAYSNSGNEEWAIDNFRLESAGASATLATVTTTTASGITATTATLGGEVTDNGGAAVTERGIVYNTTGTPNVDDDTQIQIGSGDGSFADEITGLSAGTTYFVRAYAINSEGTGYGNQESFTPSAPNIAPIVDANTGLTVTEGATGNIDSGKLHFNDDETGDDAQLTATITTAVAHGTLFLDANLNNTFDAGDEALTISATFTQDDVNNDRLRYTNTVGNQTSDSFVFTLSDPDGGELANQTFTITINQLPTVTVNNGLTLNEGTTELIDSGKLNATDNETGSGSDITFTITSAVSYGVLFVDSNPSNVFEAGDVELVVNATFTQDDINNDRLRYTNTVSGQNEDSFEFKVSDPDGGELANQTFSITINQVPTVTVNNGLTLNEGTTELIDSGKLNATDNETGSGSDITFTITSAVSYGVLFVDSNPSNVFEAGDVELVVNATFTQDDINNDRLRYTNTVSGQNEDSFEFKVSDPDGGELANQTFSITINQVPTVTVNNGLTLNEGTTELIDSGKLNATDNETGSGSDITFTITSAVSYGVLFV